MHAGPISRKDIEDIVLRVLRDVARPEDMNGPLGASTALFGDDGVLDSVGLVSLVVGVEQAIEEEYGAVLSLADEKALSQRHSPYRTVGTLAEYASQAL